VNFRRQADLDRSIRVGLRAPLLTGLSACQIIPGLNHTDCQHRLRSAALLADQFVVR
jgi:hypothetical protein